MIILILAGVMGFGAFVLLTRMLWAKARPKKLNSGVALAAVVLVGALLLLTATGRFHWIAAVVTGIFPFLKLIGRFVLGQLGGMAFQRWMSGQGARMMGAAGVGGAQGAKPDASSAKTADLEMTLDHATGVMDGTVLHGAFANRRLSTMTVAEVRSLFATLRDGESHQLLTAYLDRREPGWAQGEAGGDSGGAGSGAGAGGMTAAQALEVLGLAEGASEEEIVEAHRRLIHKLHPDRGGSDYLAATLNEAKKVLLGRV